MNMLDQLTQDVAKQGNLRDSVAQFLRNVGETVSGLDTASRQDFAHMLSQHAGAVTDHILAGTPLVVGTHPHPESPMAKLVAREAERAPSRDLLPPEPDIVSGEPTTAQPSNDQPAAPADAPTAPTG